MNFTYGRDEKLKSRATIDLLFTAGKSVGKYPLRLTYIKLPEGSETKVGVSVSKKYFRKAADRNYYKRILREMYRLNKGTLFAGTDAAYAIMFFYQSKDRLAYSDIEAKTISLFQKFAAAEATNL